MKEQFGENLKKLRDERDLTQSELAERLWGKPERKSYIAELESGKRQPTVQTLVELAKALSCSITDLQPVITDTPVAPA